jgi:hypothetical protein
MSGVETVLSSGRNLSPKANRKLMKACSLPLFLGGTWLILGLGMTFMFARSGSPLRDYWLSRSARVTEGTVKEVTRNRWTRDKRWTVRYGFEAEGRRWQGESYTTSKSVADHLRAASETELEYLPWKPAINRAKGTRASLFSALELLPALLFVAMGGAILAYGIARILRLRNLLVNGQIAVATITEEKLNKLVSMGKRKPLDVYYVFQDSRGTEWTGRTRVYFPRASAQVEPGQELKIVYDYLNPKRSFAYELYDIEFSERL